MENYGVDNPSKSEEVLQKIKETTFKNHGVESYLETDHAQKKAKEVMLDKYGVEYALQSPEIREKVKETFIDRYGSATPNFSKTEKEIGEWLNAYGFNFKNDFEVLDGLEIDLLDKNINIGIEYDGLFWHNDRCKKPKDKEYHWSKWNKAQDKGVKLITIFEDEWVHREKQCKNMLRSILGISESILPAEICDVKEISQEDLNGFCEENYIGGAANFVSINYGLFHENNLVGVCALKNNIFTSLCFKDNFDIVDGYKKLFEACLVNKNKFILAVSDNRWYRDNIYEDLGFVRYKSIEPDFHYIDLKKLIRYKSDYIYDGEMQEDIWYIKNGLSRIYDCGKTIWRYQCGQNMKLKAN